MLSLTQLIATPGIRHTSISSCSCMWEFQCDPLSKYYKYFDEKENIGYLLWKIIAGSNPAKIWSALHAKLIVSWLYIWSRESVSPT